MNFEVAPLPYAKDALQPVMSAETLEYHYEKHHKGYMSKLKELLQGKPEADRSLEEIVKTSAGSVFNNAAQVWNHTFFWNSMRPEGGGSPGSDMLAILERDFGGWEKFRAAFKTKSMARFGSGWTWWVLEGGRTKLITTANAATPLTSPRQKPLLVCDLWEHAYYIDHRNKRDAFIEAFCDRLINWEFAEKNLRSQRQNAFADAGLNA